MIKFYVLLQKDITQQKTPGCSHLYENYEVAHQMQKGRISTNILSLALATGFVLPSFIYTRAQLATAWSTAYCLWPPHYEQLLFMYYYYIVGVTVL